MTTGLHGLPLRVYGMLESACNAELRATTTATGAGVEVGGTTTLSG